MRFDLLQREGLVRLPARLNHSPRLWQRSHFGGVKFDSRVECNQMDSPCFTFHRKSIRQGMFLINRNIEESISGNNLQRVPLIEVHRPILLTIDGIVLTSCRFPRNLDFRASVDGTHVNHFFTAVDNVQRQTDGFPLVAARRSKTNRCFKVLRMLTCRL